MPQTLTFDISPDGTTIRTEGHEINGPDCKLLTAEIEEALGETTKTRTKPEYHQRRTAQRTKTK